jgi:predicted SAM-dependent methyltransferase
LNAAAHVYTARWGFDRLPLDDDSLDFVYASHVLEHVPWNRVDDALAEVRRVLRPGGGFEVWVPDFEYITRCYLERRCGDDWRRFNKESDPMKWVNRRVFTYGPGDDNWHHACFDEQFLRERLEHAGFTDAKRIDKRTRGVSHGPIDLGMMAHRE